MINKVLQGSLSLGRALFEVVKELEELANIGLAVRITVRLIEQLESLDKDLEALLDNSGLHELVAEELLEDLDARDAEVSVAKRDEKIVLELGEDAEPLIEFFFYEVLLKASIENLDVGPLEVLEVVYCHVLF